MVACCSGARATGATAAPFDTGTFLGEPVCGGGVLSLSSFGEEGDALVWASVG